MTKHKKYYTTGDIAKYCEVDVNTVKHWIRTRDLTGFKTPSGHYRVLRKRFIEFINNHGFAYDPNFFGSEVFSPDVLIVDDDQAHRDLIINMLEQLYPNISIETAKNGFDGYMIINQQLPGLVLLDLKVDTVDGLEFIRVMRKNEKLNGINLIVVSAPLDQNMISEIHQMDVNSIIEKPISERELATACDPFLNSRKK